MDTLSAFSVVVLVCALNGFMALFHIDKNNLRGLIVSTMSFILPLVTLACYTYARLEAVPRDLGVYLKFNVQVDILVCITVVVTMLINGLQLRKKYPRKKIALTNYCMMFGILCFMSNSVTVSFLSSSFLVLLVLLNISLESSLNYRIVNLRYLIHFFVIFIFYFLACMFVEGVNFEDVINRKYTSLSWICFMSCVLFFKFAIVPLHRPFLELIKFATKENLLVTLFFLLFVDGLSSLFLFQKLFSFVEEEYRLFFVAILFAFSILGVLFNSARGIMSKGFKEQASTSTLIQLNILLVSCLLVPTLEITQMMWVFMLSTVISTSLLYFLKDRSKSQESSKAWIQIGIMLAILNLAGFPLSVSFVARNSILLSLFQNNLKDYVIIFIASLFVSYIFHFRFLLMVLREYRHSLSSELSRKESFAMISVLVFFIAGGFLPIFVID